MRARYPLLLLAAVGCATARPAASPWSTLAAADVDAVHQIILDDHPGPVDPENPGFRVWLESGYRDAKAAAARVTSYGGYVGTVRRYVAGFRDGHLGVAFQVQARVRRWPGFVVGRRGEAYVVVESSGEPATGAVLTACDGKSPRQLLEEQVFPFTGDPRLEADWVGAAPSLFVDTDNPLRALPARCEFEGGKTLELKWTDIAANALGDKATRAAYGPVPAAGVRTLADGTIWVSLPSFSTDPSNAALLDPIIAQAETWRGAPRVVFDVRGNNGGSSSWGQRLAKGLWGEAYVDAVARNAQVGRPQIVIDWRASAAVQAHVEKLVVELGARLGEELRVYLDKVAKGLADARAKGQVFYREYDDPPPSAQSQLPAPASSARVFFLTDGRCGSACLDFADVLYLVPGVVHVGLPTYADTQYMEVRPAPLPSGIAVLHLATKVWRNRPRGNEPYVPKHRFTGDIADTAALEVWILTL